MGAQDGLLEISVFDVGGAGWYGRRGHGDDADCW